MTYEEAAAEWKRCHDPFNSVNVASEAARPDVVREWLDYPLYRQAYSVAWSAMMGSPFDEFDEDSPLDGLAYGAFTEGWNVALRRVGQLLGVNPERFRIAVNLLGEIGRDDLPDLLLADLRLGADVDLGHTDGLDTYLPDYRAHYARTERNA